MKITFLNDMEIADFCLQLALLLQAGVRLSDGLFLLAEEEQDTLHQNIFLDMAHKLEDGALLAEALNTAACFPSHVVNLIEVGERVGRTEETLFALSHYYEEQEKRKRQLHNALTCPAILLLVMLIVILVLLTRVLPIFDDVYASLGGNLTGLAGGLLSLGNILSHIMPIIGILLAIIIVSTIIVSMSSSLRNKLLDSWMLHWGDKGIFRQINNARFAQALALVFSSGIPFEECVTLSGSLLKDCPPAVARCESCRTHLDSGDDLATALNKAALIPASSCRMLMLAMRSGTGDIAITKIARRLSEEAEEALETRLAQIEPALVLITSILVGAILLAVMLPLINIMKAIG